MVLEAEVATGSRKEGMYPRVRAQEEKSLGRSVSAHFLESGRREVGELQLNLSAAATVAALATHMLPVGAFLSLSSRTQDRALQGREQGWRPESSSHTILPPKHFPKGS